MSYTLFELNNTIDAKLTRLGKSIDTNIMHNFIVFGIFTLYLLARDHFYNLPGYEDLKPDQYLIFIPLLLVFLFVRFGFVSLRFLKLMVERDKTILTMVKVLEDKKEHLIRLKNVYRLSSFGEVFYKTLIFGGIEFEDYKEEPTKTYKVFTYVCIIFIVIVNTLLTGVFLCKYFIEGDFYLFGLMLFGILIMAGSYVDYLKKLKLIKKDIVDFYDDWLEQDASLEQ